MADLVIPYDAKPDYDSWGPDDYWDLATWVGWHRGLKKKYGSEKVGAYPKADKIWLDAWTKQTTGASPTIAILQPSRFKAETDYIKKFPLLYQYTNLKKAVEQFNPAETGYTGVEIAQDVIGAGADAAETAANIAKILKVVIPVVLVVAIAGGMYVAYNKFVKA